MELSFEFEEKIADGKQGTTIQYPDAYISSLFQNTSGELLSQITGPENEDYSGLIFTDEGVCAKDINAQFINISNFLSEGLYGTWLVGDQQKLIIFMIEFDISKYIDNGSISYNINVPVVSMSVDFKNPDDLFTSEDEPGLMDPSVKITFSYSIGDSVQFPLGAFYADNTSYTIINKDISISARNLLGKALKDQSFDENNSFTLQEISTILTSILSSNGVEDYDVQETTDTLQISFKPDEQLFKGIEEILKAVPGWKIEETAEGKIVIGASDYSSFPERSSYEFIRGTDVIERNIVRDDRESYTKVCVHNSDFSITVYKEVTVYRSWRLGSNKTLYVQIADGTNSADAEAYTVMLANKLSNVGTVQAFKGPFRPWLLCGDEAKITNDKGEQLILGLITNITHYFGKSGYFTEFTVDSGGVVGVGRMSDYIKKLQTYPKEALREY